MKQRAFATVLFWKINRDALMQYRSKLRCSIGMKSSTLPLTSPCSGTKRKTTVPLFFASTGGLRLLSFIPILLLSLQLIDFYSSSLRWLSANISELRLPLVQTHTPSERAPYTASARAISMNTVLPPPALFTLLLRLQMQLHLFPLLPVKIQHHQEGESFRCGEGKPNPRHF